MKRLCVLLLVLVLFTAAAEPALTIGNTSLSDGEVMAYSWSAGESYREISEYYEKYLGIDYWSLTYPDGMSMEDSIAFDVFKELLLTCALCEKADESGVSISVSDKEFCSSEAEKWYATLISPAFTLESVISLYEKQLLAERVYAVLVLNTSVDEELIESELTQEDYRVYEAEYLYTVSDNDDVHSFMLNSTDFSVAALLNRKVSCGTLHLASSSNKELFAAAAALEPGQTSGIIKTDYGFFLLRLIYIDDSAKDFSLDKNIYSAREAAFLPEYNKLFTDSAYTIYDSFRSSVILR